MNNKSPRYTYNGQKHIHDLSHRNLFTSPVGMLVPFESDFLLPSDNIKIGFNLFTRTAELETAAFTRVREHIDVFFVPIRQLWRGFDQFIYGVGASPTSLQLSQDISQLIPNFGTDFNPYDYLMNGDSPYLDDYGFNSFNNFTRLWDMLGYGRTTWMAADRPLGWSPNLLRFAAYHKIFYDYYNLDDWSQKLTRLWNFDDLFSSNSRLSNHEFGDDGHLFLQPHYRPWKKDYFIDILPSPLMSSTDPNTFGMRLDHINNWLTSAVPKIDGSPIPHVEPASNSTTVEYAGYPSTASIRAIFAVDRLLEITRRNKKDYAHQTLGHFGFHVPEGISEFVYKVGSISQDLMIQPVESTATTEQGVLGQVGALGVSGKPNNHIMEFTAPCHGILMAIYSAEPILDYKAYGVDRQNTYVNRYDIFTPEYDNLGMQPVFGYQYDSSIETTRSMVYGWQYRYQELKEKYNIIHHGFYNALPDWFTAKDVTNLGNSPKDFYINPNYLDSIMLVNYNGSDDTDPLRHSVDVFYHKSSVMTNFSLPNIPSSH